MNNIVALSGLFFKCPFEEELESCCFKKMRDLDTMQRVIEVAKLSEEEVGTLLKEHRACYNAREIKNKN